MSQINRRYWVILKSTNVGRSESSSEEGTIVLYLVRYLENAQPLASFMSKPTLGGENTNPGGFPEIQRKKLVVWLGTGRKVECFGWHSRSAALDIVHRRRIVQARSARRAARGRAHSSFFSLCPSSKDVSISLAFASPPPFLVLFFHSRSTMPKAKKPKAADIPFEENGLRYVVEPATTGRSTCKRWD